MEEFEDKIEEKEDEKLPQEREEIQEKEEKTIDNNEGKTEEKKSKFSPRMLELFEFLKFLGFSISAGVIQIVSFEIMFDLIGWKVWWACHLISLALSVVWNFTFNRKFTFKSASNVPLAMSFAFLFYVAFTPASVFGGQALKDIGWNGTLVEALMMVINFVLEFVWDKFVVFNDKFMSKIEKVLKIHNKTDKNIKNEGKV
ncbi:MAG: GtrA family protein [Clostridia bacterium]|nr:GtrA family protein [Clostridia bacterium]